VQLELAGRTALEDGRYPLREDAGAEPLGVLIVQADQAPGAGARPRRRRRERPRPADPAAEPQAVPVTRVSIVEAEPFAGAEAARRWLGEVSADADRRESEVAAAIAIANRALHASSLAAAEPAGPQVARSSAIAVRIGYGTGDEVAAGRWTEAVEVPEERGRVRRIDALRPTERVAAILGARERPLACETLILRARADLDAGRDREAALQLRAGVEAILAELGEEPSAEQRRDLDALAERGERLAAIAQRGLRARPTAEERADLADALAVAERVLRRRRILGG